MNADAYALTEGFAYDRQLTAPLFQRPCVWEKEEQWQPLWEDVQGIADALVRGKPDVKPHCLGAIVLDQIQSTAGRFSTTRTIDGQQRPADGPGPA